MDMGTRLQSKVLVLPSNNQIKLSKNNLEGDEKGILNRALASSQGKDDQANE